MGLHKVRGIASVYRNRLNGVAQRCGSPSTISRETKKALTCSGSNYRLNLSHSATCMVGQANMRKKKSSGWVYAAGLHQGIYYYSVPICASFKRICLAYLPTTLTSKLDKLSDPFSPHMSSVGRMRYLHATDRYEPTFHFTEGYDRTLFCHVYVMYVPQIL